MDDIESSVMELQRLILAKAPNYCPAVFPTSMKVGNIYDICCDSQSEKDPHRIQISKWLEAEQCSEDQVVFATEFNYKLRTLQLAPRKCVDETEKLLSSLELMMSLYVSGTDKNLIGMVNARFLELNNYDELEDGVQNILYEVCNLCYSLKVLISNLPGIQLSLAGRALPLAATEDAHAILRSISRSTKKAGSSSKKAPKAPRQEDEDEEDNMDEIDEQEGQKKKRRKKRGGK